MSSEANTKKRKRVAEESPGEQVTLTVLDKNPSDVGPVLACFPSAVPPSSASFSAFIRKNARTTSDEADFASKPIQVVGESKKLEYLSTDELENGGPGCKYFIGVRNKKTNVVTIRQAPLRVFTGRVKALKSLPSLVSTSAEEKLQQRNALGETFGTKKAQKAIRAAERNKVDVSAMEGVTEHIQESIAVNTKSLPTNEEAEIIADSNRHIPPHDLNAQSPEDLYKLFDIIPEAEFNALSVNEIIAAKTLENRIGLLPHKRSEWIRQRMASIFSSAKPNKRHIKIVLYISALMIFRLGAPRFCNNKEDMQRRLQGIPPIVLDGMFSRFTETMRGTTDARFTSDNRVNLFTHMFALCLHVDNFSTDTTILASDLNEQVSKINQYFKLLGCKIAKPTNADIVRFNLQSSVTGHKFATLRIPPDFPKPKAKRRNN